MENFPCKYCSKEFHTLTSYKTHLNKIHKISGKDYVLQEKYNNIPPVCLCGCGSLTNYIPQYKDFGKWINGHKTKVYNFGTKEGVQRSIATRKKLQELGLLKGRDSEETRRKKSESHLGEKNANFGKKLSKEKKKVIGAQSKEKWKDPVIRNKIEKSCKEYWAKEENKAKQAERRTKWLSENPSKFHNTKLEQDFAKFLDSINVKYIRQYRINNKVFDFRIENTNLIIETDGDFWHCNPKLFPEGPRYKVQEEVILNDKKKELILKEKGFKLIRIWESELKEKEEEVKQSILKEINDTSRTNN